MCVRVSKRQREGDLRCVRERESQVMCVLQHMCVGESRVVCATLEALQQTAPDCNRLQQTATDCYRLQNASTHVCQRGSCCVCEARGIVTTATDCNRMQQTAKHCNRLQQTEKHCHRLLQTATECHTDCNRLQQTATDCNRLPQTATNCHELQQTATHIAQRCNSAVFVCKSCCSLLKCVATPHSKREACAAVLWSHSNTRLTLVQMCCSASLSRAYVAVSRGHSCNEALQHTRDASLQHTHGPATHACCVLQCLTARERHCNTRVLQQHTRVACCSISLQERSSATRGCCSASLLK